MKENEKEKNEKTNTQVIKKACNARHRPPKEMTTFGVTQFWLNKEERKRKKGGKKDRNDWRKEQRARQRKNQ